MSPDYKKSLDLLHRINAITIEGKSISSYFVRDGYDMWGSYQMSLFADIKRWTMYPEAYKQDKKSHASFLRLLLLAESLLALVCARPKVLLYTIDKISSKTAQNDGRIDPLYEVLVKEKIRYLEIVHAVSGPVTIGNFFTRRRLVVYLEAFMFGKSHFDLDIDLSNFSEKDFVTHVIQKYHHRFHTTQKIKWIFKFISPQVLWGIDDVRHTGELLMAAKQHKVPTYLFQHGHFTKYHVGWLDYKEKTGVIPHADYIVVWNEYWKKELVRLGTYYPEKSIMIGGEKAVKKINIEKSKNLSVLIPYETDAPKDEIRAYIYQFKKEGIKVYLKVRNDISHSKQMEEYGVTECVTDIVPVTAVVGVYSTLLYDVLGTVPVGILNTTMDYGYGMVENNLAGLISLDNELRTQIELLKIVKIQSHSVLLSDTVYSIAHTCGCLSKK